MRIRQSAVILTFALLLGAVGTYLSCWGMSFWLDSRLTHGGLIAGRDNVVSHQNRQVFVYQHRLSLVTRTQWRQGQVWRFSELFESVGQDPELAVPVPHWAQDIPESAESTFITENCWGWPFRALCSGFAFSFFPNDVKLYFWHNDALTVRPFWNRTRSVELALVPLWPGFLLNTLLHAAMILAARHGLLSARAALRRRHHRCPTCNYNCRDLHSPNCPECGKPHGIHTPVTNAE